MKEKQRAIAIPDSCDASHRATPHTPRIASQVTLPPSEESLTSSRPHDKSASTLPAPQTPLETSSHDMSAFALPAPQTHPEIASHAKSASALSDSNRPDTKSVLFRRKEGCVRAFWRLGRGLLATWAELRGSPRRVFFQLCPFFPNTSAEVFPQLCPSCPNTSAEVFTQLHPTWKVTPAAFHPNSAQLPKKPRPPVIRNPPRCLHCTISPQNCAKVRRIVQ